MTAVETAQRFEYEQASEITRVRWLAEQGWQLHSVVPCGGNIVYLMERPTDAGLVAERDAALSQAAEAQRCLSVLRGQVQTVASSAVMIPGPAMDNALLADRDRLAREVVGLRRDLAVAEAKVDAQAWDDLAAERDRLAEQVRRVAMARVWTNEDGKRFLFADDVLAALKPEVTA